MVDRLLVGLFWTAASFLVLGGAVECVVRLGLVNNELLPPPTQIVAITLAQLGSPQVWTAVGNTLLGWAIGMIAATVIGLIVGTLVGSSSLFRQISHAPFEFLRPVPPIVLLPLVVLLLGPTLAMKIVLIFIGAVWPVLYQTSYGVREVDPVLRDTAKVFGVSQWRRTLNIVVPSALPMAMTGIRVAAGIAFVVSVVAELVGGAPGIGREMIVSQGAGVYGEMYGYVVIAGILGLGVNAAMTMVEAQLLHWHPSQQQGLSS